MSKMSRDKGKRGELEIQHLLTIAAFDFTREQDGREQSEDFRFEGHRAEVRRREQLRIEAWCQEIESKTPDHETPIVIWRRNGQPWRVSLLLSDYIDLVKEARS